MATHKISVTHPLSKDDRRALDAFGTENRGMKSLAALQTFLQTTFNVDLVLDPSIVEGFTEDSSHLPHEAQGVCRPKEERECAVIMRACTACGIPMTLSGGRSNLTGSATPEGGIVISTARMLTPDLTVDIENQKVTAPAGMILEEVRNAIISQSDRSLCLPVDPTSRSDASLGGAIACNASGFTPGETGAIRAWVQTIQLILPDGGCISATRGQYISQDGVFILTDGETERIWPVPRYPRPAIKNASGPFSSPDGTLDLIDLIVGAEGLFGVITSCELTLAPRPENYMDIFFSLPAEADALKVLNHVMTLYKGDLSSLSAFEYFGINCRTTMDHEDRFFHGTDTVGIYIQQPLHGQEPEDAAMEWMELLLSSGCELDEDAILLLDNDKLRTLFMEARHSLPANALEVVQQRGTYTIMTDTVVPPEAFEEFLKFTHHLLKEQNLDYVAFGHLGDCHLHFTLLPKKEQLDAGVAAYDAIIAKSAALGGVYSGEHGTGKRKRKDFLRCYGPEAEKQVRASQRAVDPGAFLNRGNVVTAN